MELGQISGVFGFKGELRLFLHHPDSEMWDSPCDVVLIDAEGRRRAVRMTVRPGAGKRILGRVPGVDDEASARALVGNAIAIQRARLPEPEVGAYYVRDLAGVEVRTEAGVLGTIVDVVPQGPTGDVWVVEGEGGTWFLPATDEVIRAVVPGESILVDEAAAARHKV